MTAGRLENVNIARQRRFWSRRAGEWDHGAATNPGLVKVVERIVAEAAPGPGMIAVDLGCGSGQLALRLAPFVDEVIAIDVSQAMIDLLEENARGAGIANVVGRALPMERFTLAPGSVDVVVSNYALHHLRDRDKAHLVSQVAGWLRPGGRFVVGDMMFGRGSSAADRQIIASKLSLLLAKGPAGWWRVMKNATRYLLRVQERPVSAAAWVAMFEAGGLVDVRAIPVVNEASVVRGSKPT